MQTISQATLKSVYGHGESAYPEECCGLIFVDGTVHRACNIQNELHAQDPAAYPRDASRGYTLSLADTYLLDASLSSDLPVRIIYHSHPDVGAYFSDEDKRKALFAGEPVYPVGYLVLDISPTARGAKLFCHENGDFRCVATYDAVGNCLTNHV
jgi:proteasome lid subunit RPN8/RPN11